MFQAEQFPLFDPESIPVIAEAVLVTPRQRYKLKHKVDTVDFPAESRDRSGACFFAYDNTYDVAPSDPADADEWEKKGWGVWGCSELEALANYARTHSLPLPGIGE